MRRAASLAGALVFVAMGCTTPRRLPTATPRLPSPAAPTALASPRLLAPFVLTASACERPAIWDHIAFIPFGDATDALGYHPFPDGVPSEPYSFAIASDGSIWIADRWKFRMAHYSGDGHYQGEIPVNPDDRMNRLWDVVFIGGEMLVATSYQFGHMDRVSPDGSVTPFTVKSNGRPLFISGLFSTRMGLVILTGGFSDSILGVGPQGGPFGYLRVDPTTGSATQIAGLPIGTDQFFSLDSANRDQDYTATYSGPDGELVQPVRFDYMRDGSHTVPAVVGAGGLVPEGDDVLSFVQVSAAEPRNETDGGRWLLRLGRSPILWERLPFSPIDDSPQWRHVTAGPDGAIYLMLEETGGVDILRRP